MNKVSVSFAKKKVHILKQVTPFKNKKKKEEEKKLVTPQPGNLYYNKTIK